MEALIECDPMEIDGERGSEEDTSVDITGSVGQQRVSGVRTCGSDGIACIYSASRRWAALNFGAIVQEGGAIALHTE